VICRRVIVDTKVAAVLYCNKASIEMNVEIRTAELNDAVSACNVLRRSISGCCFEDHRNDEAILAAWLGNKTPETVEAWFLSPANFSVVAVADREIVGVAILTRSGKIALCYVTPEARFTGAGKALLQALEKRANKWGIRSLQVTSTVTGKPFYLRNGFVLGGTTQTVFGCEAITLSKKLSTSGYPRRIPCGCGE
jgi:GNAT superfamily N-acetyltransferase